MCGSSYFSTTGGGAKGNLVRDSFAFGSVVERGKVGVDAVGGVPLLGRGCPPLAGSVVRHEDGGAGKGVTAGVDVDCETGIELVGLSLVGILKFNVRGELGFDIAV